MHRKPLRKVTYARFRRRVRGYLRQRSVCVHARYIDDISARLYHIRREYLRYQKRACDIQIEYEFQAAFVKREKVFDSRRFGKHILVVARRFRIVPACAVDQIIHRTEFFVYRRFRRFDILFIQTVTFHRERVFADFVRYLFRRFVIDIEQRDFCSARRQRSREFAADDSPCARDGYHFFA